jgi:hypothetical protein
MAVTSTSLILCTFFFFALPLSPFDDGCASFLDTDGNPSRHVDVLGVGIALVPHLRSSELLTPVTGVSHGAHWFRLSRTRGIRY